MVLFCSILSSVNSIYAKTIQDTTATRIPKQPNTFAQGIARNEILLPVGQRKNALHVNNLKMEKEYRTGNQSHKSYPYGFSLFPIPPQIDKSIQPPYRETDSKTPAATQRTYTMSQLHALSYKDLTKLLVTINWSDITDLFQFNADSLIFYQDHNRVKFLIKELEK